LLLLTLLLTEGGLCVGREHQLLTRRERDWVSAVGVVRKRLW
jgi:hypothetical protein